MLEKDQRARKVAVVAHCLLNQNAKVNGFAFFPDMIKELIDALHKYNYGIVQLPCPETVYAGMRRCVVCERTVRQCNVQKGSKSGNRVCSG